MSKICDFINYEIKGETEKYFQKFKMIHVFLMKKKKCI